MEDVEAQLVLLAETIRGEGLRVVRSPSVVAPDDAGSIFLLLDGSQERATLSITTALSANLVVFSSPDAEGFEGHIVARPWVRLVFMTPEALTEAIGDSEAAEMRLDERGHEILKRAVDQLKSEIGLSAHGGVPELGVLIRERVRRDAPSDADQILQVGRRMVWDLASDLQIALKDRHVTLLRTQAAEFAARIVDDEGPFAQPFLRAAQRDLAYRWGKRLDPTCTTKASSDPIALELGALVNRH